MQEIGCTGYMAHKFHETLRPGLLVILLPIVIVAAGAHNNRTCSHYGVNFEGRCFWFVDVRSTWYEAVHMCHSLYGDHVTLVTIKDKETNDFIRNQWQSRFWIGLHEAHGETKWLWVDNTEPANGNYQNWEGGASPPARTGNRNCGLMKYDNDMWTDYDCGSRAFFVCAELHSAPMCPKGGIFFRDRCYWRGTRQLSWAAANQACQEDFGQETRLAVARDAETNLFLSRLAGRSIWLGLSDRTKEGVWTWIDGAPLEYRNWAPPQPLPFNRLHRRHLVFPGMFYTPRTSPRQPDNRYGMEDCVEIQFPSAKWNDVSCGNPYPRTNGVAFSLPYICAVPPCYETTGNSNDELVTVSNEEVQIIDHSICARTECIESCVNGGACNSTGQCICVQQFSGMTCNLDEWEVKMENEFVNSTTGSTLTLKCKVNLPVDHISSLTWTKCETAFLPQYRHTITNSFSQGYSILQISDVSLEDAGQYQCKVVLSFHDTITLPVVTAALVNVAEGSTPVPTTKSTTERTTTLESQTSPPISSTNSATTTKVELMTNNSSILSQTTIHREATTPLATTKPTTKRTIPSETSTQIRTTKPIAERTSTVETRTSVTAMKQTISKRTSTRAVDELPITPSEGTADKPTNQEQRTKRGIQINSEREDASKSSAKQPARGTSALIVILFIVTTLLLGTVFVLMMKLKRKKRSTPENVGLIELEGKL